MAVRIIGLSCLMGEACNPGHPPRPAQRGSDPDGLCRPCHALGRVVEGIQAQTLTCCVCGGDPRGGEVQPVFGAGLEDRPGTGHAMLPEPLMFCRECATKMRARQAAYANATQATEALDALEVQWRAQFGDEAAA